MFRVTRLGLAKTGGRGRLFVSSLSNDKNAGFGLKVFEKTNSTQLNGPNFPCRQFFSYRYLSLATEDVKGKKFSHFARQKVMDGTKKIKELYKRTLFPFNFFQFLVVLLLIYWIITFIIENKRRRLLERFCKIFCGQIFQHSKNVRKRCLQ
ncbi:unnamed protein product [Meloidogyne enterolobii]|uniref:Uncharacterized protein n=1 Tax=Meloidogyne enterolobii TaxID=390850 RepID=A0ACB1AP42_MELEN